MNNVKYIKIKWNNLTLCAHVCYSIVITLKQAFEGLVGFFFVGLVGVGLFVFNYTMLLITIRDNGLNKKVRVQKSKFYLSHLCLWHFLPNLFVNTKTEGTQLFSLPSVICH